MRAAAGKPRADTLAFRIRSYDEVDSTNERVKEALRAGEPEGLVVCARRQSGGYGRQGRSWASPAGGLYLSILLRPAVPLAQLPTLSLMAGLAVRSAIAGLISPAQAAAVQVKWPNDVVFAGCGERIDKLCGISLERIGDGVCVGIGVNVLPVEGEALEGKNRRCCLSDLGLDPAVSLADVRDAVLAELADRYGAWCAHGFVSFREDYAAHALLTAKRVTIEDIDGTTTVEGRVEGVDDEGRLLVRAPDGTVRAVSSGEVHISSID